jgi:hypothetical protein
MTKDEERRDIELLVESAVTCMRGSPGRYNGPIPIEAVRLASQMGLRVLGLPVPDDVWLDALIRELAEFYDVPVWPPAGA